MSQSESIVDSRIMGVMEVCETNRYKVLVVDDNEAVLQATIDFLSTQPMIGVVGAATGLSDATKKVIKAKPDIILIGLNASNLSGVTLIHMLQSIQSTAKFVLMTTFLRETHQLVPENFGAHAFVSKYELTEQLMPTIYRLMNASKDTESQSLLR